MPIHFWSGDVKVQGSWAKQDLGLDVYIVCPGPSLAEVAAMHPVMRGPGRFIIAMNTSYPRVTPDLWVGMDRPECYDGGLWREAFPKIMGSRYEGDEYHGTALRNMPNTWFLTGNKGEPMEVLTRRDHSTEFLWIDDTFWTTLHIAIWMGGRRIHFVGCDLGGPRDYHDDRELTAKQRNYNRAKYAKTGEALPRVAEAAAEQGIAMVSCSPGSPLNDFLPYVPLGTALTDSHKRDEKRFSGGLILHGEFAELCRWARPQKATEGEGVIVGCNKEQEWLLPWWWLNYSAYNDRPVAFADFGMSNTARQWCRDHGYMIEFLKKVNFKNPYFGKPLSILSTPFRRSLWMDMDVQVCGSVDPWFADMDEDRIYVGEDPFSPWKSNDKPINSGVVCVAHGHSLIQRWMELMYTSGTREDQSVLNRVWAENEGGFCLMPSIMNWLRLMGDPPPQAVLVHWTGPVGKAEIKRQMVVLAQTAAAKESDDGTGEQAIHRIDDDGKLSWRECRVGPGGPAGRHCYGRGDSRG